MLILNNKKVIIDGNEKFTIADLNETDENIVETNLNDLDPESFHIRSITIVNLKFI